MWCPVLSDGVWRLYGRSPGDLPPLEGLGDGPTTALGPLEGLGDEPTTVLGWHQGVKVRLGALCVRERGNLRMATADPL